eukprot:13349687-Alexandrium_andersonii.AAC.1
MRRRDFIFGNQRVSQWVTRVWTSHTQGFDVHVPLYVDVHIREGEDVERFYTPVKIARPQVLGVGQWRERVARAFDVRVSGKEAGMLRMLEEGCMEDFWQCWSETLEQSMCDAANMNSQERERAGGHGRVRIVKAKPGPGAVVVVEGEQGE